MPEPTNLLDLDLPALEAFFAALGERPFRARQFMHGVYKRGARDFAGLTELGRGLRARLAETASLALPRVAEVRESSDGTRKLLLELADGEAVETVLIPDGERLTQCVSSQVGCAMGCAFCRTAGLGLRRNLSTAEIVGQVLLGQDLAGASGRVTNVVFMGMGEPLANLDPVLRAFRILSSDHGLNITRRRLTISTCGLVPALEKLPPEVLPSLAISLNATSDAVRDRLMPVNRRYPIALLLETLGRLPLPPRARFTVEYVLIGGVNDSLDDARRLVRLLSQLRCKVNLIAYNPHPGSPFRAPDPEAVEAFQNHLLAKNFTAVLRRSRGQDIQAACGQLRAERDRAASRPPPAGAAA